MSNSHQPERPSGDACARQAAPSVQGSPGVEALHVRELTSATKAVWRPFPGPRGADAVLRVAIERAAYADLTAHAKESLDAEVCGVLAGRVCEDDEGTFIHVEATIRGTATAHGSRHVTFTQATWNAVHAVLDRDYPKLRIMGWYHTHPGFGVEFSDMDAFIQRHFFPGLTYIALVTDPVNGAVALCRNSDQGIEYLERFWVGGREQQCRRPVKPRSPSAAASGGSIEAAADLLPHLEALESRVNQLIQIVDEQRTSFHRFLLLVGMAVCLGIIGAVGHGIYVRATARLEPPRLNSFVPIPVRVGDRTLMLGVGVVEWNVPDELNALLLELEQRKAEAAARASRHTTTDTNVPGMTNAEPSRGVPKSGSQP